MEYNFEIPNNLVTPDVDRFVSVCSMAVNLYAKKNADYGNSFQEGMDKIGMAYGVGRIFDKVNRLVNLYKKEDINYESVFDTIMDLACYSIMLYSAVTFDRKPA